MKVFNEKGYALFTVLGIMSIFMLLALSFMGNTTNSMKLNKIVEEKSKSVALAEMGVVYYKNALKNSFSEVKSNIKLMQEDAKDNKNKSVDYVELAVNQFTQKITGVPKTSPTIQGSPEASFTIEIIEPQDGGIKLDSNNKARIKFKSIGNENGRKTTLTASVVFKITEQSLSGSEDNGSFPNFDKIIKPEVSQGCINNPANIKNCKEILFTVPTDVDNKLNNIQTKTIYSTKKLTLNNANGISNLNIHTDDLLKVDSNMNSVTNSIIVSKLSADFGSQLKMNENSEILIGGNLNITGHLELDKGSTVYVDGSATIDKHLKIIDPNSKVCVKGSLSVGNKKEDPYNRIFVYSENPDKFNANCGGDSSNETIEY